MKERTEPSVERWRAISDLELKLVTSWLLPVLTPRCRAVWDFEAVEEEAEGSDLVEEDFGGDAECGVRDDVVEDERIGAIGGGGGAGADGLGTVGRKLRSDGDVVRVVVVDAAGDDEIAGQEVGEGVAKGLCEGRNAIGECGKGERGDCLAECISAIEMLRTKKVHWDSCGDEIQLEVQRGG